MRVLVTGGSGYIGSHTCVQLLQNGHDVIILDNLCNSKRSVLPVIERLGGKQPTFVEGDIRNEALMTEILHDHAIETVIHFAGLKAVGESVAKPLEYYDNNVNGTLRLISAMRAANVKNFIFSSSATVYGDQPKIPYVESFPTGTPQSPYGKSKLMVEQILTDLQKAQPEWSIALLRYFNPVGAHPSGDMGEDPQGIPNNLMPYIARWRWAAASRWRCSAMTIQLKMAPACVITSTLWIWPTATWQQCSSWPTNRACIFTTSAPVLAAACWMWLTPSAKPAVSRSTITSPPAAKETSRHTGLMQPKPIKSLTGVLPARWMKWHRIPALAVSPPTRLSGLRIRHDFIQSRRSSASSF